MALRALRHRDRSVAQLDEHLARRGFSEAERSDALATLARTGVTDDARFAQSRARSLAERGAGDALIRHELRSRGVDDESIDDGMGDLEPEIVRAERIVERRGRSARTARFLAAKGFSEDVVYAAVARGGGEPLG